MKAREMHWKETQEQLTQLIIHISASVKQLNLAQRAALHRKLLTHSGMGRADCPNPSPLLEKVLHKETAAICTGIVNNVANIPKKKLAEIRRTLIGVPKKARISKNASRKKTPLKKIHAV